MNKMQASFALWKKKKKEKSNGIIKKRSNGQVYASNYLPDLFSSKSLWLYLEPEYLIK